jgi:hypothetical protein
MAQEKVKSRSGKETFQKRETRSIRPWHRRITVAPFGIADMKIEPSQAHAGETIVISFKATNSTNFISIYPVVLKVNEEVITAEVVSLPRKTVMLMEFRVSMTMPGEYNVEVNDSTGKFAVTGSAIENEIAKLEGIKPDLSGVETGVNIRAGGRRKPAQQRGFSAGTVSGSTSGKPWSILDKIGSGIEIGLDKLGDAIIFSIEIVISPFTLLFKLLGRNRMRDKTK